MFGQTMCAEQRRDINFHFKWNVQRLSQIANNKFMFSLGNSPDLQQNKFNETVYEEEI